MYMCLGIYTHDECTRTFSRICTYTYVHVPGALQWLPSSGATARGPEVVTSDVTTLCTTFIFVCIHAQCTRLYVSASGGSFCVCLASSTGKRSQQAHFGHVLLEQGGRNLCPHWVICKALFPKGGMQATVAQPSGQVTTKCCNFPAE